MVFEFYELPCSIKQKIFDCNKEELDKKKNKKKYNICMNELKHVEFEYDNFCDEPDEMTFAEYFKSEFRYIYELKYTHEDEPYYNFKDMEDWNTMDFNNMYSCYKSMIQKGTMEFSYEF